MKIGVLALQGDFREHRLALEKLGVETVEVRLAEDLEGLEGLILPGGESTTMGKLMTDYDMLEPLRAFGAAYAMWGTCAGAILLSQNVGREQPLLKLMDTELERNAFGRQCESFEINLPLAGLEGGLFHAVFIRAPVVTRAGPTLNVLARLQKGIVALESGKHMALSFHPELGDDTRLHERFLRLNGI